MVRTWRLPALVMPQRRSVGPVEYSEGTRPTKPMELGGGREALPVTDFGGEAQGPEAIDASVGGQAGDLGGKQAARKERPDLGFEGDDAALSLPDGPHQLGERGVGGGFGKRKGTEASCGGAPSTG